MIPTLTAGPALADCLDALEQQAYRDFRIVVVDNSGLGLVREQHGHRSRVDLVENERNLGFGTAINQGFRRSPSPFLATLNDDAAPDPNWLARLMEAVEVTPGAGMWASQVRLSGQEILDSAGMLLCPDGSSKQRGHGQPARAFDRLEEVLFPSGSAALYRRKMLEEIGLFDENFFLYCEDTDLGLRGRWAGWNCFYVPQAVVYHRYSHSAGRASSLKARYVERHRIFVITKNFPLNMLLAVPFHASIRYAWHLAALFQGQGVAGAYRRQGGSSLKLPLYVLRAHWDTLVNLPYLLRERRRIRARARLSSEAFRRLVAAHSISPREVAAQ